MMWLDLAPYAVNIAGNMPGALLPSLNVHQLRPDFVAAVPRGLPDFRFLLSLAGFAERNPDRHYLNQAMAQITRWHD